jgi:hypothetical protein
MEVTTCIEVSISIDAWNFSVPLPYTGNFLSILGNTSTANSDSVSLFCGALLDSCEKNDKLGIVQEE